MKIDPNCIFCKIVRGEVSCYNVYEDKDTLAFLDIHPINPGHMLVIPKNHYPNFYDSEEKDYLLVMKTARKMARIINKKFSPKKVGLLIAGWDVDHSHIHVVPMEDYHDLTSKRYIEGKRSNPSKEQMREILNKIKDNLE